MDLPAFVRSISDRIDAELERLSDVRHMLRTTRGGRSKPAGISRDALKHPFLKTTQLASRVSSLKQAIHEKTPHMNEALEAFLLQAIEVEAMQAELVELETYQVALLSEQKEREKIKLDEDQRAFMFDLREMDVTKGHLAARTPALMEKIADLRVPKRMPSAIRPASP